MKKFVPYDFERGIQGATKVKTSEFAIRMIGNRWGGTAMVTGGNATVFITDMDAAISFYTGVLGMKLTEHYGDAWATLQAGDFAIGLHPKSDKAPPPGTSGSIQIGLMVDDIQSGRERLAASSAKHVAEIEGGDGGSFLHFQDPDGNDLYLWQMPKWG